MLRSILITFKGVIQGIQEFQEKTIGLAAK